MCSGLAVHLVTLPRDQQLWLTGLFGCDSEMKVTGTEMQRLQLPRQLPLPTGELTADWWRHLPEVHAALQLWCLQVIRRRPYLASSLWAGLRHCAQTAGSSCAITDGMAWCTPSLLLI